MPPKRVKKKAIVPVDYDSGDDMDVDESSGGSNVLNDAFKFIKKLPYATSALGTGAGLVLLSRLNQKGILTHDNIMGGLDSINPSLGDSARHLTGSVRDWMIEPVVRGVEAVNAGATQGFQELVAGQQQSALYHDFHAALLRQALGSDKYDALAQQYDAQRAAAGHM